MHKRLDVEYAPCRFSEKHKIDFASHGRVPAIKDDDVVVTDSWDIAGYLDDVYPDRATLLGAPVGHAEARFFNEWAPALQDSILRTIIKDIHEHIDATEQPYFRESREKRFGSTLVLMHTERDSNRSSFNAACA